MVAEAAAGPVVAEGFERIDRMVRVGQRPIGRTPRSDLAACLWPGAGSEGGRIVAAGTPAGSRRRPVPYCARPGPAAGTGRGLSRRGQ